MNNRHLSLPELLRSGYSMITTIVALTCFICHQITDIGNEIDV